MHIDGSVAEKDFYLIYTRVKDDESDKDLGGIMKVYNLDNRFEGNDEYIAKYNRITVGPHHNATGEYWKVTSNGDGTYRIASDLGMKDSLATSRDENNSEKWKTEASLEAVVAGDKVVLRHRAPSNAPGQKWKIEAAR